MTPLSSFPAVWRGALLALAALLPVTPWADTLPEDNVKAGFILNFAKYTEWPALGNGELRVCGLGQFQTARLAQLQRRQAHGLEVRVYTALRPEEWRACQVLFIPAGEAQRVEAILRAVAQAPVLTIGEGSEFVHSGGMIALKERGGRIRFDVNQDAAHRVGLSFSSHLLKLADEVLP